MKGRGAVLDPANRFDPLHRQKEDDGWWREDDPESVVTVLSPEQARTIISRNASPDLPFDRSINAYRGCEHGCVYCYARPTHAYIDLSPGLDFETRITFKPNAPELLRKELAKAGYRVQPIAMGTNTDPYQPVERRLGITRALLQVLLEHEHPVTITTKGGALERDYDLLAALAERNLVAVAISITTLDNALKRVMEPRAAAPARRLAVVRDLVRIGVPVTVMAAPVIPFVNDDELEAILAAGAAAGARDANYLLLRLPLEVKDMFRAWLEVHFPDRARRVMSVISDMRGGKDYDARFGVRMRGEGVYAQLLARRFAAVLRKVGLRARGTTALDCTRFRVPGRRDARAPAPPSPQMSLF
jgi:DNA repair photolyase